jgi:galactokinase
MRKQVKEMWLKDMAHMHNVIIQMKKARNKYVKCQQELEQVCEESQKSDQSSQGKYDKRKVTIDEAVQKVR